MAYPPSYRLVRRSDGRVIASRVEVAQGPLQRAAGLIGRRALGEDAALVLPRCRAIHMCFMRFSIDAVFVDAGWRVVALHPTLGPWRMTPWVRAAASVVELPCGGIARTGLALGDHLSLDQISMCQV